MKTSRIIQVLSGAVGALIAILVCALAGVNFSTQEEVSKTTQENVLMGQSQTNMNFQISEANVLRSQIQQLQYQLTSCEANNSFLRMQALTNQMTQQRR